MAPAVTFKDVYKEYPFYQHITAGFKSFLFHLPKSIASLKKTRFIALKGISFKVEKGEVFGIIGRNGSGKSTILGLTAGVMRPDRGSVITRGKISSLLELGAGFHPELSGIENIILNGILSGNTREDMMEKMQEIIAFSELGDFVYQPLRTYSSGMQARLGFSVAVHIDPEILLVDEALAVGDLEFKEKCNKKMKEFMESGATIIIVSHDMPAIAELCNRVAWVDSGTIMHIGSPRDVIKEYLNFLGVSLDIDEEESPGRPDTESYIDELGTKQDSAYVPESIAETVHAQEDVEMAQEVTDEAAPVPPASWWDSPVIMHEIERIITGYPELSFYDYLKNEHSIAGLEKGLSICHTLKGLEQSFVKYHTCSSFDVLDDRDVLAYPMQKIASMKPNHYDLLLTVDFLSHIGSVESFLEDAHTTLKGGGVVIALEYTDPPHFQWTDQEIRVAGMLSRALNNESALMTMSETPFGKDASRYPDTKNEESAASSGNIVTLLRKRFDIIAVRYFGGALLDLILNRILCRLDQTKSTDVMLIKTILQCEQVLMKNGVLRDHYAMIIARKSIAHGG